MPLTLLPADEQLTPMPVCRPFSLSRACSAVLWFAAAALAGTARADGERPDLQISQLKNVRMGFFSSIAPERLAQLQFAEVGGVHRQVGPFQIATPGFSLKDARLEINATPCTPADWTAFTASLAMYRAAQLPQSLVVRLPDGRECLTPRFPVINGVRLVFASAQLRTPGANLGPSQTVVVVWDSNAPRVLQLLQPNALPATLPLVGSPATSPANGPVRPR